MSKVERWWSIHDDNLRFALKRVADGECTAEEAYAVLFEHADTEYIPGKGSEGKLSDD
jgi:hypothetical protein